MARKRNISPTVAAYIDERYWPVASRRLQATSLDTYAQAIRNHIRPWLGAIRLDELSRDDIQKMLDWCATEKVARKALSTLKTILNEAVGDGLMATNPACAKYALPAKGGRAKRPVLTDFAQIGQFIDCVANDGSEPILRLVAAGLLLGLRPEERYALNYEDLDFAAMTVTVHGAYVAASSTHGGVQMKPTKTALSTRVIPMPRRFADLFGRCRGQGAWIVGKRGRRMSPNTAQKQWSRYLDEHPWLPRVTLENMRHSFATACLHAGMHVEDLSRMLGHSNINTTYSRYVRPDLKNMRDGLAAAMNCGDARKNARLIRIIPGQRRNARSSILRASTSEDDA